MVARTLSRLRLLTALQWNDDSFRHIHVVSARGLDNADASSRPVAPVAGLILSLPSFAVASTSPPFWRRS